MPPGRVLTLNGNGWLMLGPAGAMAYVSRDTASTSVPVTLPTTVPTGTSSSTVRLKNPMEGGKLEAVTEIDTTLVALYTGPSMPASVTRMVRL